MRTIVQQIINTDLDCDSDQEVPADERSDYIDYCLAAHAGFESFPLPDDQAPAPILQFPAWLLEAARDESRTLEIIRRVAAQFSDAALTGNPK